MSERTFPDRPWLGVGGLVFQDDKILLIKRGREPGLGQWSIPGGMVEVGETVREAVQREVREETGLLVEALDLVEVFERILPDARGRIQYHYVMLDYHCRLKGGTLAAASDATEAGFSPVSLLEAMKVYDETIRVIRKAYAIKKAAGG
jgi:8-oxo-dGTP diphosphatase